MKKLIFVAIFIVLFCNFLIAVKIPVYVQSEIEDKDEMFFIVKGKPDSRQFQDIDCEILSVNEEFTTLRIKRQNINSLSQLQNVTILPAKPDKPLLEQSTSDLMYGSYYAGCNADAAQAAGIDGNGVIIGILDYYPLNWKHEDFYSTSWSSEDLRVLYIWNQQDDSGTHPTGFDFGSEYTKADLMADNGPAITSGNHGTQCTGIAAGDGSGSGEGSPKMGIAPAADIIYVHKIWNDAGTINAITYFQNKADELQRPIVISFSGGTKYGFPDGSDIVSQSFDNFSQAGRIIAVAGGNYYTTTDHALGTTTYGTTPNNLEFTIDSYSSSGDNQFDDIVDIAVFYKQGDNFDVTVTDPASNTYQSTVFEGDNIFDTMFGRLYVFYYDHASLEVIVTDEIGTVSAGDEWVVSLSVPEPAYDEQGGNWSAWIYEKNITAHFNTYNTSDKTLNIYATGEDCICVAAHSKTSGSIRSDSSAGLTYDNRQKPELSAPTGASTTNNSGNNTYSALGGTSGAAPHVAGTLALMLQRFPNLTPNQARQQLIDYVYNDSQTVSYGVEPNKRYGYGKLNTFCSVFPQLNSPQNVQLEIINDGADVLLSWDNEGFVYNVYSSSNPDAVFPSDDWTLEASVIDMGELLLTNSFSEKRFFLITAD